MTDEEKQMLDECLDRDEGLSNWDIGFIESLDKSFRNRELSPKQIEHLERITGAC